MHCEFCPPSAKNNLRINCASLIITAVFVMHFFRLVSFCPCPVFRNKTETHGAHVVSCCHTAVLMGLLTTTYRGQHVSTAKKGQPQSLPVLLLSCYMSNSLQFRSPAVLAAPRQGSYSMSMVQQPSLPPVLPQRTQQDLFTGRDKPESRAKRASPLPNKTY